LRLEIEVGVGVLDGVIIAGVLVGVSISGAVFVGRGESVAEGANVADGVCVAKGTDVIERVGVAEPGGGVEGGAVSTLISIKVKKKPDARKRKKRTPTATFVLRVHLSVGIGLFSKPLRVSAMPGNSIKMPIAPKTMRAIPPAIFMVIGALLMYAYYMSVVRLWNDCLSVGDMGSGRA
jgi:hypothetical protein